MSYLSSNQLKQYKDEGFGSPINIFSKEKAKEIRDEIELIEKEMPGELDKSGRYNAHLISPLLDEVTHHPKILDAVQSLIGEDILVCGTTLFIKNPNDWDANEPIMIREGIQFHWKNNDYKSFDDFLSTLSSRKRKQIKKERQCLQNNNLEVKLLTGDKLKKEDFDFFYECYLDTTGRKWGSTYLKKEFFMNILSTFKDKILLMIAVQDNIKIASALNFLSETHLYGRLWGSKFEVSYLHFELCYYQAIDYAIANKIKNVEAGAQGEHKLSRGYLPQKTWSAHWIKEKDFSEAINKFLNEEAKMINHHKEDLEALGPYKT